MRALRPVLALVAFLLVAGAATYTIRPGDTLSGIARRLRVSVGHLAAANGITNPDRIVAGQVLDVPGSTAPSGDRTYTVQTGDTLSEIAARNRTTVARLVEMNGLRDPNRLRAGVTLRLPPAPPSWVCPVQGPSRYRPDFGEPRGGGRRHEGVDLVAPGGTTVVANVDGVLRLVQSPRGGLAYYLTGGNGDVFYGAHLDSYVVQPGRVRLGQAIGRVGTTGNAVGGVPHLHFERKPGGGVPADPYPYLAVVCLRANPAV